MRDRASSRWSLLRTAAAALLVAVPISACSQAPRPPSRALRSASDLARVSATDAAQNIPVWLDGVVTYVDPRENLLFVQDSTGGAYVTPPASMNLNAGDTVLVRGVTAPGLHSAIVGNATLTVIGRGAMPTPHRASAAELASGELSTRWVRVEGTILSAQRREAALDLTIGNGTDAIPATIALPGSLHAGTLVGRRARADGVAVLAGGPALANQRPRLLVPSARHLLVTDDPAHERSAATSSATAHSAANDPGAPLSSASAIRHLTFAEANRAHPVRLTAVVTYWDPVWSLLFVQDSSAGVYVSLADKPAAPLRAGTRVRVEGVTSPGDFAPIVSGAKVREIGTAPLPPARLVPKHTLLTGSLDSQQVELEGLVRTVKRGEQGHLTIQIRLGFSAIAVVLPPGISLSHDIVDAWVRIRGVCGSRFNQRRQLTGIQVFVPDETGITVLDRAGAPAQLPFQRVSQLLQFSPDDDHGHRRRTRGTITYVRDDVAFVSDGEGSVGVHGAGPILAAVGDQVEVIGYPVTRQFGPALEDAVLIRVGESSPIQPHDAAAADIDTGELDGDLVRIQGRVLDSWRGEASEISLLVQSNGRLLTANLAGATPGFQLPRPGSIVAVSGIFLLTTFDTAVGSLDPTIRILMRSADDIAVIAPGPWWTVRHTLGTILLLTTIGLATAGWGFVLRRRVREQTAVMSERLRRETALEQNYRRMVEEAYDAMWTADENGRFVRVNRAAERLTGYSRDELLGAHVSAIVPNSARSAYEAAERAMAVTGEVAPFEIDLVAKSGRHVPVEVSLRRMDNGDGHAEAIVRDITRRKELEEQLRASQKMEAVGRLAGGVAHDFNNLLTAIIGYTELAAGELADSRAGEYLDEVKKASERAAALTQQLLAFGRRQVSAPKVVDVNDLILDTRAMLERIIGEDIVLQTVLAEDLPHLRLDPVQFAQVLMNLAVNARDAMPRGGRIIVRSSAESAGERTHVVVDVEDNGVGIPPDVLPHIFEPFFTTKEQGKGTGLGLAVCYGIIEQAGGSIAVRSCGEGTTFTIKLPALRTVASEMPMERRPPAPAGGKETILVVEDERQVRELACRTLEASGYRVISAANAEEAMTEWQARNGAFDLLLTDVVMPGRSGPELAADLLDANGSLKVLYVSGYADRMRFAPDALEFLAKPYTPQSLQARVRAVLDDARAASEPSSQNAVV